jgi:hypothetical protein
MADYANFQADDVANVDVLRMGGSTLALMRGFEVLDPIREAAPRFATEANVIAETTRDEKLAGVLLERIGIQMFRVGRRVQTAALEHKRSFLEGDRKHRQPAESIDRRHDVERRARYRALDVAGQMTAIATADLADLTALTADGNLADLAAEAFALAEERFLVANTLEKTGLASRYALTPTVDQPLASGVDSRAAERAAEVILDAHRAMGEMVEIHERAIRDYTALLANVFNVSQPDAFARLVEGG